MMTRSLGPNNHLWVTNLTSFLFSQHDDFVIKDGGMGGVGGMGGGYLRINKTEWRQTLCSLSQVKCRAAGGCQPGLRRAQVPVTQSERSVLVQHWTVQLCLKGEHQSGAVSRPRMVAPISILKLFTRGKQNTSDWISVKCKTGSSFIFWIMKSWC